MSDEVAEKPDGETGDAGKRWDEGISRVDRDECGWKETWGSSGN